MSLTPAQQEALYDAQRDGSAYIKPQPGSDYAERFAAGYQAGQAIGAALNAGADDATIVRLVDQVLAEEDTDRCCANGTPERDCPACAAKYEAARQQVHARAAAAPTASERADILLSNHEMPDGDQIFDLLLEDHVVSYVWHRCIDWVLYRQRRGLPVKRMNEKDDCPAAIDARFSAARDYSSTRANWNPNADGRLLSIGDTIERWERTPAQEAEIQRSNDLMIAILEAIGS